ncbi:MAG: hypothetical protein HGA63_06505, partial [Syntrophobacteraceae bacterium]|nr:hypothetical protein [Syntrophobacteraceae bacterium]
MDHHGTAALSHGWQHSTVGEQLLEMACESAPVLKHTLAEFGDCTITGYLKALTRIVPRGYQERSDLGDAVYRYGTPLLGEAAASKAARDLEEHPVVLTANHHGVDYFAQSVQGTLLFSLMKQNAGDSLTTVPVFSCGNIPMNNLTYPLGMLIYQLREDYMKDAPKRLPIFPDRHKRTMVSTASGCDRAMVDRAVKRVEGMSRNGEMPQELAACAREMLLNDYGDPSVMGLSSYSEQSVVLNQRTWKRLFSDPHSAPDLAYLELEKLVRMLLEVDLLNRESLAWKVMFDPELRGHILEGLDGHRICWHQRNLSRRLRTACGDHAEQIPSNGCGTLFFWGVDGSGRKIPLIIERDDQGKERLRGLDDRGTIWDFPFSPAALLESMRENRLIPSLFTCYLTVALARGVVCLGGYYQAEYLPAIQRAVLRGLRKIPGYHHMVKPIGSVPTDGYLSGMQTV